MAGGSLRAMAAAARIGFRHHLAYRSEVVLQLASASLVVGLNGTLWTAAGAARPVIAGEPAEVWRGLVLVAWAGGAAVSTRVHEELGARFADGQIAADLLRPLPLSAGLWARDAGRAAASLLVGTLPLLVLCAVAFPAGLTLAPWQGGLWVASLALAHAANVGLSFLIGLAAMRVRNVVGLSYLKATLVSLFSGALIPLELFPSPLRFVAFCLPFHTFARSPAAVLLGREPALPLLLEQAAWAGGLWVVGVLAWRHAAHILTVEGG